jgi:hypothetical protein
MAGWLLRTFADPKIGKRLLRHEHEVVVDEVRHHWVVYVVPILELIAGLLLVVAGAYSSVDSAWFPWLLAIGLWLHAAWRSLNEHMDRFVITNMRVFRVQGVLAQSSATMPLRRILDITVVKPLAGRMLGYGHFVFESAAQEQGLREIRYVGRPDERDLTIQGIVQRTGLRGMAE